MMFPPCQFADRLINQRKRFCHLKEPRPVSISTCAACPHAGKISDRLEPICGTVPAACIHRGPQVSTVGCTPCGGTSLAVHSCQIHEQCTISRDAGDGTACCAICRDRATGMKLPPLDGPANLAFFVFPRRETRHIWERQQEVIREAIGRFDGRKLCAIACDDSTCENEIDRSLWDDVIELENDRERWELPGWQWAMRELSEKPGFTVRLHAKGTVRGTAEKHLQTWWEIGFAAMLDTDAVRRSLESAIITGPFRRFGHAANLGTDWHYSGSFYAFRNAEIFARDWMPETRDDASHYVEAWPALVATKNEAACIAFDGVGDLYQLAAWKPSAESAAITEPPPPMITPKPSIKIAPLSTSEKGWEGALTRKPWEYQITAAIPTIGESDALPLVIDTLRAQTERPYIVIIDTGSDRKTLDRIELLRAEDVEIHSIRSHGWRHPSEPVTAAMDLALSMTHTPFLFCTHSDCFLKRREMFAEMVELCGRFKAVGYQLSPRKHPDWQWMLGHTCTMFDVATLDRINAAWSIRRLCNNRGVELVPEVCGPNWPDTELLINYQLSDAGIKPHLIGSETNFERTNDDNIDHCRSLPASLLYSPEHRKKAEAWMADAMQQARQRLKEWGT